MSISKIRAQTAGITPDGTLVTPASFAQARIWLDERIRFDPDKPQVAIYNMPFVYRLQSGHTLSIKQLHHALHLTVNKHPSLHTSLYFDIEKNLLMQRVITHEDTNINNNMFSIIETTYETDTQLNEILHDEKRNPHLFDLAQGIIFRCHLVYYKDISSNYLLSHKDLLIFNFHHALFDFPSMKLFYHDLNQAYTTGQLLYDDNTILRYLDYSVIEQEMSMTGASMFWLDALHDCKLDQPLSLPFDRYRLSNEHRTGRGTSISFDFGQDLSHDFVTHASSNSISLEYLALATYYVFLFKLTNGERDLCIGINTHGRYRDELNSIIGMFVNAIPLRCQLDPHLSFHEITKHVQDNMINCMKYSYFPLQRILNQHPNISNPVFLDTSFEFLSSMTKDEEDEIMIGDSRFSLIPDSIKISEDEIMSKFDFILSFQQDLNLNEISCTINASLDLFNIETVCVIAQRLQTMLHQQFTSFDCTTNKPIYETQLALPNEQYLMQSLNNTQVSFPSPVTCIHHEFVYQVMKHPQKLAVQLDEQSLTYNELLFYVQQLALQIINKYDIKSGDIICQCVERSLSMIIGSLSIEIIGSVYCPLSPENPEQRLQNLVEQTQARVILVHSLTNRIFKNDFITYDIDTAININDQITNDDLYQLSNISITPDDISYIVFTSGSTGIPKAVQVRHRNLTIYMQSVAEMTTLKKSDNVIQMASCSFDTHFQDTFVTLMSGASLVMLHPHGNKDLTYLIHELTDKDVTFMDAVPSYLDTLCQHLEAQDANECLKKLRTLCSGGDVLTNQIMSQLKKYVSIPSSSSDGCQLWNVYGPAEVTITTTYFRIGFDFDCDKQVMSIGKLLPNYISAIMDDYFQFAVVNQEGELFVGGACVFAGYFGRNDSTAKALVEIDDELFYRTGDLVRINSNGLLYYQGRKDHQIKLHGQRIELGEIERCLLNTSISACVVMKWNDDYLVAYVQSSDVNEQELREYCQSYLPPHMVPSVFIILDKLPLNANGKVDRKQLPSPQFSLSTLLSPDKSDTPLNQFEERIHTIWCQVLHYNENHISGTASFFSVGGHSLRFIELYYRYQSLFNFDAHSLSIGLFLQQPTIRQHAQLLQTLPSNDTQTTQWQTLHINQDRLWNNNTFWLQHILGTPLYNCYLRLCGARISLNTHIYTTTIDAPWLLEIDDETWIANETCLNCLYFNDDNTFKLSPVRIGSNCSIGTRSILFDGVDMQNNIIVQPMSSVTGFIASEMIIDGEEHKSPPSNMSIMQSNRSFSIWHKIYQIIVIISIICIHCTLLILFYKVYSVGQIPLPISIAFCWTLWSVIGCFISLLLLKFIVGPCTAGEIYPIASWLHLQKIWLRQLVLSSFHHAWLLPAGYDYFYPYVLRWLGAHVEENVKLAEIDTFLSYPTNLLKIETGVTTFGGVSIVPTDLTFSGDHRVDQIVLGSHTNLANGCSILP
ncbi:unnamed protein product, partial [Adineta steineri]